MILRLSSPAQRGTLVAVSLVLAFSLFYFGIRNARAAHFSSLQTAAGYERAVQLEPGNPSNWFFLGRYWQYNLEDPDAPRAIRAYLTALSLNPLDSDAWLDLASAHESESNLGAARDAYVHAKKVDPRSAAVSWRFGNFLLRQGELEQAFSEMRLAVQADPKRAAEAFSRSLRAGSTVDVILDRVLPPLAEAYVDVIWDQTTDGHTANALEVWDRLTSLHPRLSLQDSFSLVSSLMIEKRIPEASRVWDQAVAFAGLSDLQGPPGSLVWDGGFESGINGGGFSWLFPGGFRGAQVSVDSQEKHSGARSVRLIFQGNSDYSFDGLCHFVPVQPSTRYRFSAWIQTRALTTDQGVRFRLRSLGAQDTSSAWTPEVHGTQPWTQIGMPWSSGKDVQELQICVVRSPSTQAETRFQGTAWIDDVALTPEPAERLKP